MNRRVRRRVFGAGILAALFGAGLWGIFKYEEKHLAGQISKKLNGAEVRIARVRVGLTRVEMDGLRIARRDGEEILSAPRVEATWTLYGFWRNELEALTLSQPHAKVSTSANGEWNFEKLRGEGGTKTWAVKALNIRDGQIELGQNPWGIQAAPIHLHCEGISLHQDEKFHAQFGKKMEMRTEKLSARIGAEEAVGRDLALRFQEGGKAAIDGAQIHLPLALQIGRAEGWGEELSEARVSLGITTEGIVANLQAKMGDGKIESDFTDYGKRQTLSLRARDAPVAILRRWLPAAGAEQTLNISAELEREETRVHIHAEISSAGDLVFPEWGFGVTDWHMRAEAHLHPMPQEWSVGKVFEALTVTEASVSAGRARFSGAMGARDAKLQATLAKGALTARAEAVLQPTGKLTAEAQGTLWPTGAVELTASVTEAEAGKLAETFFEDIESEGPFEARGRAKIRWKWDFTEPLAWEATSNVALGPAQIHVRQPQWTAGGAMLAVEVAMSSQDTSQLKISSAGARVARVRRGEEEIATGLAVGPMTGKLSLSEDWQSLTELHADVIGQALRYGSLSLEEVRAKLGFSKGILSMDDVHFSLLGAKLETSARVNIVGAPSVELRGHIEGLNMHRWAQGGKIQSFDVDGAMDGDAGLRLEGTAWRELQLGELNVSLTGRGSGKVLFLDNEWTRALKQSQPLLNDLIFSKGNEIAYDTARVELGLRGADIVGQYTFHGKTVAPNFTVAYHDATFQTLVKRLEQLSQAKIGAKP